MRCWQHAGRDKAFLTGQRKGSTGASHVAAVSKRPLGLEGVGLLRPRPQRRPHGGGGAGAGFEEQIFVR